MSTGSYRQLRLAVVDDTTSDQAPLPVPALRRVELSLVVPMEQAAAPAWDPHEVWLNRVKKPRDARGGVSPRLNSLTPTLSRKRERE